MSDYSEYVWAFWLLQFLAYEIYAAVNKKKGDTLSENVGDWVGVKKWSHSLRRWSPLRRTVLLAFMASLAAHLVWGLTVAPVIGFGAALSAIIAIGIAKEK